MTLRVLGDPGEVAVHEVVVEIAGHGALHRRIPGPGDRDGQRDGGEPGGDQPQRQRPRPQQPGGDADPDQADAGQPLAEDRQPEGDAGHAGPSQQLAAAGRVSRAPEGADGNRDERHHHQVVERGERDRVGQQHRGIADAGPDPGARAEEQAGQPRRGGDAGQRHERARQPHRELRGSEGGNGDGLQPEVEDRLVEERLAEQAWHRPVAALHHLLRDGRVQTLVVLHQRRRHREGHEVGGQHQRQRHPRQWRHALPRTLATHQRTPTNRNRQSLKNSGGLPSMA